MDEPSDYTNSGFDKFLSRGDTPNLGGSLDQNAPNNSMAFDRNQVSGFLGDILAVGKVNLDGPNNTITISDDNNLRVIIGLQANGTQGIIISKEGKDANINRPTDLLFNSSLTLLQAPIVDIHTFPSGTLTAGTQLLQQFKLPHNIQGVPGFNAYAKIYTIPLSALEVGFPNNYYTQLTSRMTSGELGGLNIGSQYLVGIDENFFYVNRLISNSAGVDLPYGAIPVKYFIFQQSISSTI